MTNLSETLFRASIFLLTIVCFPSLVFGEFTFVTHIITTSADGAHDVYAIDLDGDGDIDVLSASAIDDRIVWYENDGAEGFTTHDIYNNSMNATYGHAYAYSLYAIDLDGDNDIDVLSVSYHGQELLWHENDGSEGFTTHTVATNVEVGEYSNFTSVYAIDIDSDVDIDICSSIQNSGKIIWLENGGSGNFTLHHIAGQSTVAGSQMTEAWDVYAIDLDKDGDIDVLSANQDGGAVANEGPVWHKNDGFENFTEQFIGTNHDDVKSIFAIDLDKDSDVDVLCASFDDGKVTWYENDGSGTFSAHNITTSQHGAQSVYAVDIDGDNDIDVLSASHYGAITWYKNNGSQSFSAHNIATVDEAKSVFAIDLDGDGDMDVLSASSDFWAGDDEIAWYENDQLPSIANPISDVTVNEDAVNTNIDLSNVFTDADNNDALIAKSIQANTNPALVSTSIGGNTLTLDYQDNQNGTSTITIRGTSNNQTVDDQFTVTVNAVTDAPIVSTDSSSSVTSSSATLNGTVNPDDASTTVVFEWGTDDSYGNAVTATESPLTGTTAQAVSAELTGLTPGATYHFRVKATNSAGTTHGDDKIFTTDSVLPTLTTIAVSSITSNTASSGGDVTSDGGADVTARGVCWSTSANPTIADSKTTDGTGIGTFTSAITGLSPGTSYHVRAYATNSVGTSYGSDISFITFPALPLATTGSASSVISTSSTLNGSVNPNGASTTVTFEYGTSTSYGSTVSATQSPLTGITAQSVSAGISSLTPGTIYHFRVKATNSVGTSYGEDQTFMTSASVPTATTDSATSIASGSATLNATVNPNGASTTVVFEYGISTSYGTTVVGTQSPLNGTTTKAANAVINGLTPGMTYHFRVKATNSVGTTYGSDQSFTYPAVAPTVTTGSATSVASISVTLNATVNPNGIATIYYFEYGTTTFYGFITGQKNAGSGWTDVSVSANVAGLNPNTAYHFHIVATSTAGTGEGSDVVFTTLETSPCPDCSGDAPVVRNFRFRSGTDCECIGGRSIIIGPNVTIENGARVTFKAQKIEVKPGVDIETGAVVNMRQE